MAVLSGLFKASKTQVATYLFGVALFSITFLVFLNASVSFVVTDLIGQNKNVGNAVGTLGFADELVALAACPIWGVLSDKIGVRWVCVIGYAIIGISLFVFVQARNVYPQLLLARMLFSVGGAAASTMVTAILPAVTSASTEAGLVGTPALRRDSSISNGTPSVSTVSEATITPSRFQSQQLKPTKSTQPSTSASKVAGIVGMCTGLGALLALGLFLPIPAWLSYKGYDRAKAVTYSFYIVGSIALLICLVCFLGLRNITGDEVKGWQTLWKSPQSDSDADYTRRDRVNSSLILFKEAVTLGFTDQAIGLGYLGGFVARASSVGITLFIPLFVNAYFIRTGLCPSEPGEQPINDPSDVKAHCRRAYTLAAALTGVSQVVALLSAPVYGWLDARYGRPFNAPLLVAALAGILGYTILGSISVPDPHAEGGGYAIFLLMILLGMSQIGAIVCSLGLLARGIEGGDTPQSYAGYAEADEHHESQADSVLGEQQTLLPASSKRETDSRTHLKGTIAGVYSLGGGAGILLLTKLGGLLFDRTTPGAPFYMLAAFNALLLVAGLACGGFRAWKVRRTNT